MTAAEKKVAETPLQYDPQLPTAIWCNDIWVGTTSVESGGKLEDRDLLAKLIVERFNAAIGTE